VQEFEARAHCGRADGKLEMELVELPNGPLSGIGSDEVGGYQWSGLLRRNGSISLRKQYDAFHEFIMRRRGCWVYQL
jgi:hypothetical protein